jgi:hypothetical protein
MQLSQSRLGDEWTVSQRAQRGMSRLVMTWYTGWLDPSRVHPLAIKLLIMLTMSVSLNIGRRYEDINLGPRSEVID